MTIDEAIKHCLEVAENNDELVKNVSPVLLHIAKSDMNTYKADCEQCAADHRQLAEWLTELKEAKRLLKAAVEDFAVYGALKDLPAKQRIQNPDWRRFNRVFDILDHQWRYADEALKLIEDDGEYDEKTI
jgi:hypothetical protein